ncbi:MAG: hypothetical protein E6R03_11125 [Hyphomicrobiaceae bacterium]|nr:MAG: hypothetical protein E6R03_11125 [Hyphomicrobiaceae bacterium]
MPAKIVAHKDFGRPKLAEAHFGGALPAGATNPLWNDMLQAVSRGLYVKTVGEHAVLDDLTDFTELTIAKVVAICGAFPTGLAQEIEGYPAFVQLPEADLEDDVPSYLTGATTQPEEGDPVAVTWADWQPSAPIVDGNALIELNGGGVMEPGSVIAQLVADGFTVLSLPQAQAAVAGA